MVEELYSGNAEFKKEFMKLIAEKYESDDSGENNATYYQYDVLFRSPVLTMHEDVYGKDMYDFDIDEMESLLLAFKKTNVFSLVSEYSRIKKYLLIAHECRKSVHQPNPNINFTVKDLERYVYSDGEKEKCITKKELRDVLTKLDSKNGQQIIPLDQDKAIYILAYNGIVGKQAEDLCRFKKEWFRYHDRILQVGIEEIHLEEWEADILQSAVNEKDFSSESIGESRNPANCKYIESEFLLKRRLPYKGRMKKQYQSSMNLSTNYSGLQQRMRICNKKMDTPFLSMQSLFASGVCYRLLIQKPEWKQKEVTKYLKERGISLTMQRLMRNIEIMREKLQQEGIWDEICAGSLQ